MAPFSSSKDLACLWHCQPYSAFILSILLLRVVPNLAEVVWAVNCGGPAHIDLNGIDYAADTLTKGFASDYGVSFTINRIPVEDQILYQTERYDTDSFSYAIPYTEDGDYVLSLKFSEVYFSDVGEKVFHVRLNNKITVIENLDIFAEVGFATALEKHIPIRLSKGILHYGEESTTLVNNKFTVDFIKTESDNPKINAIVLTKGSIADVPVLPTLTSPPKQHQEEMEQGQRRTTVKPPVERRPQRPPGAPRAPDPYASTELSYYLLPILGSLAAFLPILICLCKI